MNHSQGPIGKLAQGVVTSIGFASEVRGYKKAKKAAKLENESELQGQSQIEEQPNIASPARSPSSHSNPHEAERQADIDIEEPPAYEEIERSWELDEAQDIVIEAKKPRKSKDGVANPDKVIAAFLQRHPPHSPVSPSQQPSSGSRLEYPVAIPQRRPKDKKRGFIRAYAPDLQSVGIDQEAWFDFIETLNEASLANPWINALNLASLAASPLPSAISMAVSTAIMVATTIAIETQGRYRQNKALDKLNDEFFRPRGLFCLVMTWDSTSLDSRTNANVNTTIQNTIDSQGRMSHKFQSSNGVTNGMESIQTAQLIFPGLDLLATVSKDEEKGLKKKMQRGKRFVDDYMDRRAQAKFFAENPTSHLNQAGKPTFQSKYADPTYQLGGGFQSQTQTRGYYSRRDMRRERGGGFGGPLGLIGMAVQTIADRGQQTTTGNRCVSVSHARYGSGSDCYESDRDMYRQDQQSPYPQQNGVRAGRGLKNKLFKSKVLYLMVVNMPTAEEMAEARHLTADWDVRTEQHRF
ncbi:uncharacterized protein APUU_10640A [Aspergillus puulaauensis]|uniref:Uncharacterized protein n=1 Tax=Aspergillus puulaauensis TaxID=1220207 RepID=A0A7R7XAF0_9EURO|nr:uncharacterized protein APUU_10640A [Aspergillus puulaauensis]BCS17812.1 hypothetical protein APUU_10640A [Aspergillus puulaauensis]